MSAVFNALPGIEVPVGEIRRSLARLWTESGSDAQPVLAADDAKATQVNFVLHLGFNTTPADAEVQFATVVRFSRRYPGRVVVLCPLHDDVAAPVIRAKIYGECFLGKSKSDKRCVEFVMLSYSMSARPFLENQVSICLSTDLPLYYWAHRFSASGRLADYRFLLSKANRVLLDSAIAPADALTYRWPNPTAIRDLAYCRVLPVRQSIGQFLSAYPTAALVEGLRSVTLQHDPALAAEARVLLAWLDGRLADCGSKAETRALTAAPLASTGGGGLALEFGYATAGRAFRWRGDLASGHAVFEADFGGGQTTLSAAVSLLSAENALSEAMFF
jgi:hypothetical protein